MVFVTTATQILTFSQKWGLALGGKSEHTLQQLGLYITKGYGVLLHQTST